MNPDLSRQIAAIVGVRWVEPDDRQRIWDASQSVDTWDELPADIRGLLDGLSQQSGDGQSESPPVVRSAQHPGDNEFKHYWLHTAEGLAKWAASDQPWTELHRHLLKHMPPEEAARVASDWFHEHFGFYAGSDLNRVTHGHPPRGKRVGPG